MIQEQHNLLLKDLCSRLPYGVKCNVGDDKPYTLSRIEVDDKNGHLLDFLEMKEGLDMQVYLSEVKPYLLPLSSMTEEQRIEFRKIMDIVEARCINACCKGGFTLSYTDLNDWLNKNHFDYRGLIEKSLALDATGLNIY